MYCNIFVYIYRLSEKSPAVLREVIRDPKTRKKAYKHGAGNKSFPSHSHFYVKKIVIYSPFGISLKFFFKFKFLNSNFFKFKNLNFLGNSETTYFRTYVYSFFSLFLDPKSLPKVPRAIFHPV